ncbi:MAG: zinc-binding alcohol dehydrogenase family protein [Deltaproteobacteria bacterium]|nr:MAG: zinc-binding alcohol dehydrogenase family protein [Deltaproteobacteria bacterium]
MRAIEAQTFSGYGGLRQVELPKPQPAKSRVLVRVTAAGVTPLDYTILSGGHPRAKAPLVLGNEGAGVIEDAGDSDLAVGSRVMFTGPYGVRENGAWQDWLLVKPEDLVLVPDSIDDVVAASLPVAYLTAQITLTMAGFKPGMTMLAPAIGGSVGNATYQLARAQGASRVISTAGSAAKAIRARELGFEDVIDLTSEGLAGGVRRMTAGRGVDIVIDSVGGTVTGEALSSLGPGGVLLTLGYSAGRKTTIDVTDLIWKGARMAGFSLFAQSPTAVATAWRDIIPLIVGGKIKPIVERVYPLGQASEALHHLMNDRPFGKVVLERISKYQQPSASRGHGCGH